MISRIHLLGLPTMETFPLDIFTHIVDEIDNNQDHKTLGSLSTSCHRLTPLCQQRLFRTIGFEIWPTNLPILSRLNTMFKNSPHLTRYVRSITIIFQSELPEKEQEWKLLAPIYSVLASILSKMFRLDRIEFFWNTWGIGDFSRFTSNTVHASTFSAQVRRILQTPTLVHLRVRYIQHFPLELVAARAVVMDLAEIDCHCFDIDVVESSTELAVEIPGATTLKHPVIRNFSLGGIAWPRILSEIIVDGQARLHTPSSVPPFDFSQVKRLSVQWDGEQDRLQTEEILGHTRTIHSFDLKVGLDVGFERFSKMIQGALPTLTTLTVEMAYPFCLIDSEGFPDPFEGFCEELLSLPTSNVLQILTIRMVFDNIVVDKVNAHCIEPFARRILTRQGFPHLRKVTFECTVHLLETRNAVSFDELVAMDLSRRYEKNFMDHSSISSLEFSCLVKIVD